MVVSYDELDTIRQRTDGAIEALTAGGFPADRIFKAPTQKLEIPAAMDAASALLTQKSGIRKWIICGGNDSSVLGGVRGTEQHQLTPENVIGVGINGTDCQSEFAKEKPTGFYASILPEVWNHGYQTARMVYEWVKDGREPSLDTRTAGVMINRENFRQVLQ
jgi:L-arabinose transport system substrate-binding protein